jgi:outer membrane protein insertion porin family
MHRSPEQHGVVLRSLRRKALAAAIAVGFSACTYAAEFTLRDIRVEGLQRTEAGTVFSYLPFKVGDTYTDDKGSQAIRALYATGLFKDVRIEIDKDVVVVVVEERPIIAAVDFSGIKEFDKDALKKSLKDVGLGEGRPFDKSLADRAEQELKRQYLSKGLYGAEVTTTATPIERNRVNVTFSVKEGAVAKIREIRIVGAKVFSESTLLDQFDLTTPGWLTWYTKSDQYSKTKLNADLETLRSYYLNRGYLEFRIDSTQVAISPDKQDISIVINITEGEKYTVAGFALEGDYLGKADEFKSLVGLKEGDVYNAQRIADIGKRFGDKFGTYGYAFAKVEPRADIDRDKNRVNIVFVADPGKRAYVRRMNISGNTRTRDEVIRREFRQFESAWYDGDKIKLSRDRVDRLGYFKDVNIETVEVPGTLDQVDVNMSVTEKPTGSIGGGIGYSSADKLTFFVNFKQDNAFGSGSTIGLELNTSRYARTLAISSFDPYYTIDGVSRSLDAYYRTQQPVSTLQGSDYSIKTPGLRVQFGVPFSETDTVYFGAGIEQNTINLGASGLAPLSYQLYVRDFGAKSTSFPLTVGWGRDSRDSALVPNAGRLMSAQLEVSPGGEVRYARLNTKYQQYLPLSKKSTIAFNIDLGLGYGIGGKPFPIFKYYQGGGLGSVRGYETGSLGPVTVDPVYGVLFLGGTKKFNANVEYLFPFPGAGNDRSIRLFTFVDAGNVYGVNQSVNLGDLKYSAGFGINWVSPIGPLRLSFGYPIRKKPEDREQRIQFQVGTSF